MDHPISRKLKKFTKKTNDYSKNLQEVTIRLTVELNAIPNSPWEFDEALVHKYPCHEPRTVCVSLGSLPTVILETLRIKIVKTV